MACVQHGVVPARIVISLPPLLSREWGSLSREKFQPVK